jgi:hypothetical protein
VCRFQKDLFQVPYRDKEIKEVTNIKFLGLEIDKHLSWKTHIEQIIPKLSHACYAISSMLHFSNMDTLIPKMIYFAYFHSVLKYGIMFWGNHTDSMRVFHLQKKVVRIMAGAKSRVSYKPLFKALEILTLPSQYILSLITFLAHNLEYFTFNSSVHNINTRKRLQLHRPIANSASFQRGVYYVSIKILNKLPGFNSLKGNFFLFAATFRQAQIPLQLLFFSK